jgi:hypothetical protein
MFELLGELQPRREVPSVRNGATARPTAQFIAFSDRHWKVVIL